MKSVSISLRDGVTFATVTALVLCFGGWGLSTLSEPDQSEARLVAVKAKLDQARSLAAKHNDIGRYPPNMICKDAALGVAAGRAVIEASAANAGVVLAQDRVSLAGAGAQPMLATLAVDIMAKGQEETLKAFLRGLVGRDPGLLTDTLDLASDGTAVSLHLKGRFVCYDRRLP